ncbi:MAG: NrdH-redoxin [Candidatus Buchananbacteria bacterium RBG_13_36_9]|uniref:NrdH-redoxin n=1 Tax=Candidatus Buchananbacteria bacterium RBG_13_36_9 TaxID=1797530 RepID=A0A1G1XP27_9BACT|nr:MAG: NrdH-redoxin [Candidatus Buchananbacteria bacterium RBG_13_36_9]
MKQKKIIIYTTPTCPYCHQAKEYLDSKKIKYTNLDASDPKNAQKMIDKSGQMGVPVLDIEGKIIVGFDKAAIDKELGL